MVDGFAEGGDFISHVICQHKQDKMAMGKLGIALGVLCFIQCSFAFGIFDDFLGDTDKCEDVCVNTYPLHTYEKVRFLRFTGYFRFRIMYTVKSLRLFSESKGIRLS